MKNKIEYLKHEDGSYYDLTIDGIGRPLWYHTKGLMQTASGYGNKLTTSTMVKYRGRMYRVYCACHSNVGSLYIISGKKKLYIW